MKIYLFAGADFSLFKTPAAPEPLPPVAVPESLTSSQEIESAIESEPEVALDAKASDPADVVLFQTLLNVCFL